jgi:hypothetical protein
MTVLKQEMYVENDDRRQIRLKTTYDIGTAMSLAKDLSEAGGGRSGSGSGEMRVMGYIPPEMWNYDPWLMMAKEARNDGDMGEYTRLVKKFFEIHPSFAVITPKKYF